MHSFDLLLIIPMLSIGLFAGLMMTLVVVLQKQWNELNRESYVYFFRGFLLIAKGNTVISILTFTSFPFPIVLGIVNIINSNLSTGIIEIAAGVVFFFSCLFVTLKFNFKIYNKVINWKNQIDAEDWENVRKRFYALNIIRMSGAVLSFILLAAGIILNF